MGLGSGSKHKKEAERLESELGARQTELQACKRELQITKSELQTAKRKAEDLEKECDKQLKRGDEYKKDVEDYVEDLKTVKRTISQEAERLRYLRPEFYEYVRQPSSDVFRPIFEFLREFGHHSTCSMILDEFQLQLDGLSNDRYVGERGQVYKELQTTMRTLRDGRSNQIQALWGEIKRLEEVEHAQAEQLGQFQVRETMLSSKNEVTIRKLKEKNEEKINQVIQDQADIRQALESRLTAQSQADINTQTSLLQRQMSEKHKMEMQRLRSKLDVQVACLTDKLEQFDEKKRKEVEDLQRQHSNEFAKLSRETSKTTKELDNKIDQLKSEITRLVEDHRIEEEGLHLQLSELERQHALDVEGIKRNHAIFLAEEEQKHQSALQAEIEAWSGKTNKMQQGHEVEILTWEGRLATKEKQHESEQFKINSEWNEKLVQMTSSHGVERSQWQQELAAKEESHTFEQRRITLQWKQEVAEMAKRHESEISGLEETIDDLKEEHVNQMDLMREEHEKKAASIRDNHESELAQWGIQAEKVQEQHNSQLAKLRHQLDEINGKHAAELKELRSTFEHELDAYSAALLARDKFKPTPDEQLRDFFLALVQDVESISQLEWKEDRKKWPPQLIRRLSKNQRGLKQQILQDIIWHCLQEYIFCSPFRILGEEGKVLEKQWNDAYGKGLCPLPTSAFFGCHILIGADPRFDKGSYVWPKPTMQTERWRYTTVTECRATLKEPASELELRARIKKGFKSSLDKLKESLATRITEIADFSRESAQATDKMTIKAVNMWLEFGMQRCRILITENREEEGENAKKAQYLLVRPQLKRHGKSDGYDLDIEEVINGCEGESVRVSEV
jgi:hypothetical protein